MGHRGKVSKFTILKTPLVIKFDWQAIEHFLDRELSIDDRSRIEGSVGICHSVPKRKTLDDGVVPQPMLAKYFTQLGKALKLLEQLPESAQHSLMVTDLRMLVWRADFVADSEQDQTSDQWSFLIVKLCQSLGFLN